MCWALLSVNVQYSKHFVVLQFSFKNNSLPVRGTHIKVYEKLLMKSLDLSLGAGVMPQIL